MLGFLEGSAILFEQDYSLASARLACFVDFVDYFDSGLWGNVPGVFPGCTSAEFIEDNI